MNKYMKELFKQVAVPGLLSCVTFIGSVAVTSKVLCVATIVLLGLAFTNLFRVNREYNNNDRS